MASPSASKDALGRLRSLLPERVRQWVLSVVRLVRLVPDVRSYREFRRLEKLADESRASASAASTGAGTTRQLASLRVRALNGLSVKVRPGTTDLATLVDTFGWAYHVPPRELGERDFELVWDLGSNVGFTVADFARRCPAASIVGVELDPDNAAIARLNIAPWAERCELIDGAVWTEDGTLAYQHEAGEEWGCRVAPLIEDPSAANGSAMAISLNSLLARREGARVDFVKMDIEGAESRVLRENTEWAARVRAIKVEVHDPYSVRECAADLRTLGFQTAADVKHSACVIGVRPAGFQ
jgi:FkbM family methyltransferase